MKLFELRPPEEPTYEIEATHRWGLPGVICDVCGATWSNVGTCYPTCDLSALPNASRYTNLHPVTRAELEELRTQVSLLLRPGIPLPPGTDLGPLIGRARGGLSGWAWQHSWTVLVQDGALKELARAGVPPLRGAFAMLGPMAKSALFEVELELHGQLAASCLPDGGFAGCAACGRVAVKRPDELVIDGESVGNAPDLFRLSDLTTTVIASKRVVEAIRASDPDGCAIREVKLG